MKIALNEKKKCCCQATKMTSGLFFPIGRWILSALLAQRRWDATASIKLFFPQSQLLMINYINSPPHEWKKKRWAYFWPLHWKKTKRQQTVVIHLHHSRLLILLFESSIGSHSPGHRVRALPLQATLAWHFGFHSVHFEGLVQSVVFENTGLYFNEAIPP